MKSVNLFFYRPLCTSTVPKTLSTADTSNGNTTSVYQPTISLPDKLKESLNKILSIYPKKSLVKDGVAITKYIMNRQSPTEIPSKEFRAAVAPLRYGRRESIAFAAARTQSIYGSTLRVFKEIKSIDETFQPETMLDFGSGLATAVWAAHSVWSNTLYEYQTIDSSSDMGDLARALRTDGNGWISDTSCLYENDETIKGVYFKQYLPVSNKVMYDLVVSAYSLSELATMLLWKQTLASLWSKTKQYLVIIELGTPSGFSIISEAKDFILQSTVCDKESVTGHVVAPCPHDFHCPLTEQKSKCRFGQRVDLSLSQSNLRSASCYSEQFSYIVIKKGSRSRESQSRLLLPVKKRSRHVICRLCCPNGDTCQVIFTKGKHKELYREVRKLQWGDTINVPTAMYDKEERSKNEQGTIK